MRTLKNDFESRAVTVNLEAATARLVGATSAATPAQLGRSCDILVVLGGDGTILQAVHDLSES